MLSLFSCTYWSFVYVFFGKSLFDYSANFFFSFLGLHHWHMEVLRLWVKLELQLPAYTTAIAMQDPSGVCELPQLMAMPDP